MINPYTSPAIPLEKACQDSSHAELEGTGVIAVEWKETSRVEYDTWSEYQAR